MNTNDEIEINEQQIIDLLYEAKSAGDTEAVAICKAALEEADGWVRGDTARRVCQGWIDEARAQEDEDFDEAPECECACGCASASTGTDEGGAVCDECADYFVSDDGDVICSRSTTGAKADTDYCHDCHAAIEWGAINTNAPRGNEYYGRCDCGGREWTTTERGSAWVLSYKE